MVINPHDIIIVEGLYWEETSNAFIRSRKAWRVEDITNNGKVTAHDHNGKRKIIHALDKFPSEHIVKVVSA